MRRLLLALLLALLSAGPRAENYAQRDDVRVFVMEMQERHGFDAEDVYKRQELPAAIDSEQRLCILARWMIDADAAGLAWGLRLPAMRLPPDNGPEQLGAGLRALALHNHGTQ